MTAAEFCLFFLSRHHKTQNRRYFWDLHVNNASSRHTQRRNHKNQRHGRRQAVIVATSCRNAKKTDCILIDSIFSHVMGRQEYRLARALVCCMNRLDDGTTYNTHCIHIPHTTHTTYEHHIQTSRYRRHCRTKRNKHCRIQTSTTTIVYRLCFLCMSVFIHYVLLCCRDR